MLPKGNIKVAGVEPETASTRAVLARLQQLGVDVSAPATGYDYELRLPLDVSYPLAVLVEIGYLLAQLTDHEFPEEYEGFSWSTGAVPYWRPEENPGEREGIRFDVDPGSVYFRFDLKQ